ncbi:MAG: YlqD family protein [Selenomonadaceae bacterium]|nr:YlqD family protein [Selenomonadaceae bacterium]
MNSITVNVPVNVKAKLTDKLRARLIQECVDVLSQLDLEMKQINITQDKELQRVPDQEDEIRSFFGNEMNKREARRNEALRRKETLEKLADGAEILQGTTNRQVELKIGDNLRDAMSVEILVEDDKIVAIRG